MMHELFSKVESPNSPTPGSFCMFSRGNRTRGGVEKIYNLIGIHNKHAQSQLGALKIRMEEIACKASIDLPLQRLSGGHTILPQT